MRYDRAIAISKRHEELLALVKSGSYSSPSIAKKLSVSEQTVYRDILFLKRQGYPIESVKLSSSWAYQLLSENKSNNLRQGGQHR